MWQGKSVLVTGCAGFLGAWLSRALVEKGARVVGIDREYKPASMIHETSEKSELIKGSIENLGQLVEIIESRKIQFLFHLAAQSLVGVANSDPLDTFKSNIEGTWNVLEAARRLGQTKHNAGRYLRGIIVASSDKAYGDQIKLPYLEDAPMQGRFPYDVSKSCADLISQSYFQTFQVPVAITRCGNLFGAGDLNFSRIVPYTILNALRGKPVRIRSNGKPLRDYLYVGDAVEAYLMLAERLSDDDSICGQAFNISNHAPMSVLECVEKILAATGRQDLRPIIEGTATAEIENQFLDANKFQNEIGWKPAYDFQTGLAKSIDWYRKLIEKELTSSIS